MNLSQAFQTLPGDILKFSGTAKRSEYWWKNLIIMFAWPIMSVLVFLFVGEILGPILDFSGETVAMVLGQGALFLLFASIGLPLTVRRIKDTGISGWWLIAVYLIIAIVGASGIFGILAAVMELLFFAYCGFMPTSAALKPSSPADSGQELPAEPAAKPVS